MEKAAETGDYEALIVKVEQHLALNPDDLEGWKVLAPAYRRGMRWADAAEAMRNIVRLSKPDAEIMADYGEALVMANQGWFRPKHTKFLPRRWRLMPSCPRPASSTRWR
jgi:cytochrome c-type biogenesis protein CcmH